MNATTTCYFQSSLFDELPTVPHSELGLFDRHGCSKMMRLSALVARVGILFRSHCSEEQGQVGQIILAAINPEGPYILPLWNWVPKDHPHYGFGGLIP